MSTYDQHNASFVNKSINFFQKKTLLSLHFWMVVSISFDHFWSDIVWSVAYCGVLARAFSKQL